MTDAVFLDNPIYLAIQDDWTSLQNRSLSPFRNFVVKPQVIQLLPMADKNQPAPSQAWDVHQGDVGSELSIMLNLVSRIFLSANTDDEPISQAIRGTAGRDIVPKVLVLIPQDENRKAIVEFVGVKRLFHDKLLQLGLQRNRPCHQSDRDECVDPRYHPLSGNARNFVYFIFIH